MQSLKSQLKNINIEADLAWKAESRDFLLSRIEGQKTFARIDSANEKINFGKVISGAKLAWQPVAAYALAVVIFLSSAGYTISASREATPGDNLFAVKVTIEKLEGMTKTNTVTQATFASAVLGNRVNDLEKVIAQNNEIKSANENDSIILAVSEVKKQIERVNSKFYAMQAKQNDDASKFALTAFELNKSINNYKENLTIARAHIADENIGNKIDEALAKVEEMNFNVLAVVVDKHQEGSIEIDETELAESLESHVKEIETKVAQIEEEIDTAIEEGSKEELKAKAAEAKANLAKATEALKKNEYALVLSLSNNSNEILKLLYGEVYEIVASKQNDEVEQPAGVVEGVEVVVDEGQATSTEAVTAENNEEVVKPEVPIVEEVVEESVVEEPQEFKVGL